MLHIPVASQHGDFDKTIWDVVDCFSKPPHTINTGLLCNNGESGLHIAVRSSYLGIDPLEPNYCSCGDVCNPDQHTYSWWRDAVTHGLQERIFLLCKVSIGQECRCTRI
jgi:hypothetical protein